ncbi:hypothetical protein C7974DRAFT_61557 [Boeremia exigua]|uniref:uncharacterized protein n=1 Tax=Boeremia exigua TaxID=749465 RepID=UPI001E8D98C2|nr:uncharacterized protein C7974DRAFT_61557 [Boeremia exigua]KAH6615240.1 hypothetical protein C7974DRAFT_61557 [Boeremia exigua]
MRPHTATTLAARARGSIQPSTYGRAVAHRRISTAPLASRPSVAQSADASRLPFLRSNFLPQDVLFRAAATHARQFSSQSALHQQAQKKKKAVSEEAAEPPKPEKTAEEIYEEEKAKAEKDGEAAGEKKDGEQKEGEEKEGEEGKKEKKGDKPPPPPHGDKTPWQVFTETLQQEFQASKEWNEGTKQLSGSVHDFTNDPRVQRAREASEAAKTKTTAALKATASAVGQGAAWTWDTMPVKGVRAAARVTGTGLDYATRPVRQTKAFQAVKETIDDGSSSRYGGWVEKEERRKLRELRELNELKRVGGRPTGPMEEDIEAGTNITLHKDAKYKEVWRDWKDNSKIAQGFFSMKQVYGESDNAIITTARSITDRITGFFAENETAMVIKKFREIDPNFQMEPFLTEMREYILPEVLDAYVKGDTETLKQWLSAAQYSVYAALMAQYKTAGLVSDGKIVDIRGVDVLNAKLLEPGEIPVFILTARTQEVHVYRNAKSGELASGMDDKVQQVTYAIGVTRIPEDVMNPETRGWRLIELQKSARDYY